MLFRDLRGVQADRDAVEEALAGSRATVFLGHGTWDSLCGKTTLVDPQNVRLARGGILIAIACKSARDLGASAVDSGMEGYVGFDEDLLVPFRDPTDLFGAAALAGVGAMLLESATLAEGAQRMRGGFQAAFQHFKTGAGQSDPNAILYWLSGVWNRDHVTVKGLGSATLA